MHRQNTHNDPCVLFYSYPASFRGEELGMNVIITTTIIIIIISNSNCTEWSTIQGVIERVISKSDEREARGRFEIRSTIIP